MATKNEYMRIFKAFTDDSRIRVLELLRDGEKCACILLEDLNINQSTLSHHMKILCDSGIVTSRPVGKWSYYSINDSGCAYAGELLKKLTEKHPEETDLITGKLRRMLLPFRCVISVFWMNITSKNTGRFSDEPISGGAPCVAECMCVLNKLHQ